MKPINSANLIPSLSMINPVIVSPYVKTQIAVQKNSIPVSQTVMWNSYMQNSRKVMSSIKNTREVKNLKMNISQISNVYCLPNSTLISAKDLEIIASLSSCSPFVRRLPQILAFFNLFFFLDLTSTSLLSIIISSSSWPPSKSGRSL